MIKKFVYVDFNYVKHLSPSHWANTFVMRCSRYCSNKIISLNLVDVNLVSYATANHSVLFIYEIIVIYFLSNGKERKEWQTRAVQLQIWEKIVGAAMWDNGSINVCSSIRYVCWCWLNIIDIIIIIITDSKVSKQAARSLESFLIFLLFPHPPVSESLCLCLCTNREHSEQAEPF